MNEGRRDDEDDLTGEVLAVTDQLLSESRQLLDDLDVRLARRDPEPPPPAH